MKKRRIYVIGGPTASGKSALAMRLAEHINGSIVNADAIQVFKDLQVLSARPTQEDMEQFPHYLFGFVDAWTQYSLARWLIDVKQALEEASNPVVVGGTGMYIDALINGIHQIPEVDLSVRDEVRKMPLEEVRSKVGDYPFRDPQRVRRALEVLLSTGKPITYFYEQPKKKIMNADFVLLHVCPPKEVVYATCEQRFQLMKNKGAVAEVEHLCKIHATGGVLKAIGVKEIKTFLEGKISEKEMTLAVVTATRQYAKRQLTWFRHHGNPQHVIEDVKRSDITRITK